MDDFTTHKMQFWGHSIEGPHLRDGGRLEQAGDRQSSSIRNLCRHNKPLDLDRHLISQLVSSIQRLNTTDGGGRVEEDRSKPSKAR